jgi:hypothetical protein
VLSGGAASQAVGSVAYGVALFDALELAPVPNALVAATLSVYVSPFTSPVTVHDG